MEFEERKAFKFREVVDINPRTTLKKGTEAKKVAMTNLKEFTRKIEAYEFEEFKSGTKFKNNDTLFARITPCLENGKTALVDILDADEVAFGSTEFFVLRAKANITDPKFIYYLSISDEFRNTAIQSMTGTSGRQRAQKEALLDYEVNLPSLSEQKIIGRTLSLFDEKIELNNSIISNLEELAQTFFKRWFVDFEFPNEYGQSYKSSGGGMVESELGMIPEGWEVMSLVDIANFQNGLAMQKFRANDGENSLPVLKIKELRQGFIGHESDRCSLNIKDSVKVFNGDVIFSWSASLLVKLWTGGDAGLNQHLFKVTSDQFPKWFYYFWTKFHLDKFIAIAQDKATTMGHIKRSHLNESKVLVPSEQQMLKFSSIFKSIVSKKIAISEENNKLEQIRDTLLPKLLSGEIQLPDTLEVTEDVPVS